MIKKILKVVVIILLVVIGLFLVIQFIPYGKDYINPPVVSEPNWDNPQTRELAKKACFDCHSNETVWPWYSKIAPVSWLVYRDVVEGRQLMNFSDWGNSLEVSYSLIQVFTRPSLMSLRIFSSPVESIPGDVHLSDSLFMSVCSSVSSFPRNPLYSSSSSL